MIGTHLARYEIQSEIGRGGMASVYLADDPSFRRKVAIKLLPSQFLENPILRMRFEREARVIAAIEHPAIVPVYDFGEQNNQLYLVMRYMAGGSLSSRIKKGPMPLVEAIELLARLAPALEAVHAQGIVHRDIKPANILFDGFGNPAFSDFGIAQLSEATVDLTGSAVIGTPSYMSPEQVRAEHQIDGRSDVYALGVVLFEMLTGRQPYRSATPMGVAMMHLTAPIPEICTLRDDLPPDIEPVFYKVLAKEREQRYSTVTEMVTDLHKVLSAAQVDPRAAHNERKAPTAGGAATVLESDAPRPALRSEKEEARSPIQSSSALKEKKAILIEGPLLVAAGKRAQPETPTLEPKPASLTSSLTARFGRRPMLIAGGIGGVVGLAGVCLLLVLLALVLRNVLNSATALPTPDAPAGNSTKLQGRILLSDDFSQPANGWPTGSQDGGEYGYQEGVFRIAVSQKDAFLWVIPDGQFGDASLSVETALAAGSQNSYFGLLCRLQEPDHFYYFVIRDDGYYTIGKHKDGQFTSLLPGGWVFSETILQGEATNRLRVDCVGSTLRLSVNDIQLEEVRDEDFQTGRAGLAAAALGDQRVEVDFDNFVVSEP